MKVFLIGCGDIARHHGRAVVRLGGEVIGGFDISEKSAKLVSQEFGCPTCTYEQIEDSVVKADYVVISTPPTKRLDYVEMVLKHHIPLYMEKPVACTMEDAMKIKAMADRYRGHRLFPPQPRLRLPRQEPGRLLAHGPQPRLRHDGGVRQPRLEAHHRDGGRL